MNDVIMEEDPYKSKFEGNFDETNNTGTRDPITTQKSYVVHEMKV